MTDFPPTHPGEVLREDFLRPLGLSQYALVTVRDRVGAKIEAVVTPAPRDRPQPFIDR